MVEAAAETSEELLEKYLEEGELSEDDIRRRSTCGYAVQRDRPVALCGSAFKNKGVQAMLDAIIELHAIAAWTYPPIKGDTRRR